MIEKTIAYLVLEDGTVYKGESFGKADKTVGDLIFNTAVTGCQEILTTPDNKGKIILQTFPLVGNYGLNDEDSISDKVHVAGYIVRECCEEPSNFRSKYTLSEFMKMNDTVGLSGIDTRALTKKLVKSGGLKGAIVTELPKDLKTLIDEIKGGKN